jgi:hypothetical protein
MGVIELFTYPIREDPILSNGSDHCRGNGKKRWAQDIVFHWGKPINHKDS